MTGNAAVDANAYVAFQLKDPAAVAVVTSFNALMLPVVVLGELIYGAGASGRPALNRQTLDHFAAGCTLLETTADVAERYGELRLHLRKTGRPIPVNDLWIAAACVVAGVPLITRDAHFQHLPALQTIAW